MKNSLILFLILMVCVAGASACSSGPPKPGFRITATVTLPGPFGFPATVAYTQTPIAGNWQANRPDLGPVTGNVNAFLGNTGSAGYYDVFGGLAPANWNMGFGPHAQHCASRVGLVTIQMPGENYGLNCDVIPILFFTASPAVIDADFPPPSVTISGSGISSAGGMPVVAYLDASGGVVAQQYATEVASDGSWLSSPTPDLSSVGTGRYLLRITNPDGTVAGSAFVDVYRFYEPPPDPDPGPCGESVCPEDPILY